MGLDNPSPYGDFPGIYISRPFCKILFNNGLGFYILNSYKIHFIPKFYLGYKKGSYLETGFSFFGLMFEIMWNKSFKK